MPTWLITFLVWIWKLVGQVQAGQAAQQQTLEAATDAADRLDKAEQAGAASVGVASLGLSQPDNSSNALRAPDPHSRD